MSMSILLSLASVMSPVASDPAPVAAPAATTVTETATAPSKRRYCLVETPSGSHMQKKTCQTREEWRRQGLDLPEK